MHDVIDAAMHAAMHAENGRCSECAPWNSAAVSARTMCSARLANSSLLAHGSARLQVSPVSGETGCFGTDNNNKPCACACACARACCESGRVIVGAPRQDAGRHPGLLGGPGCAPERVEAHPAPPEKPRGLMRLVEGRRDFSSSPSTGWGRGVGLHAAPRYVDDARTRQRSKLREVAWRSGVTARRSGAAACGGWGCSLWCMGLQPLVHGAAAA